MQHKTAFGLHQTALEHRFLGQILAAQGQIDLVEQAFEGDIGGLLMMRPRAPRSLCSHRYTTLRAKDSSSRPGMAIKK